MESFTPPDHLTFYTLQRSLLQRRLLQKVAVMVLAIKGRISAVTRESQRTDHAVIETRMTRTANEGSSGIYIRWEMEKKGM